MKKLKVAIVGCGAVAHRWYLKGLYQGSKLYELDTVCDIDPSRVSAAQEEYNIPYGCTMYTDIIKRGVDIVIVLTRHDQHYEHCKFFLTHGMHVYSEKPIAENTKEAGHLKKIAEKNGLFIGCAPQIMLSSRNITVMNLLQDNVIGKVLYVRCSGSGFGPAARKDTNYNPIRFYQNGGSLDSLGIYNLATIVWWFGEPQKICALSGIAMPDREVMYGPAQGTKFTVTAPDNVVALLEYPDNMYVSFDGSYTVLNPSKYEFEIHGEKGSLFVGGFGGKKSIVFKGFDQKKTYVGPANRSHLKRNLSWGVEHMIDAIHEETKNRNDIDYGINVIRTIERIKTSAQSQLYT